MSASEPAPEPTSLRDVVRRFAALSRAVASLLVVVVAGRFAVASVRQSIAVSSANFEDKPAPHGSSDPVSFGSAAPPAIPASARSVALPASGKSLGIQLAVAYGPPRSEVYVNGRLVGNTPFVGDTSCKMGLPLRIEIVPDKGLPLTYQRECRGHMLEITTPPP
jgi:hypothetical protein